MWLAFLKSIEVNIVKSKIFPLILSTEFGIFQLQAPGNLGCKNALERICQTAPLCTFDSEPIRAAGPKLHRRKLLQP